MRGGGGKEECRIIRCVTIKARLVVHTAKFACWRCSLSCLYIGTRTSNTKKKEEWSGVEKEGREGSTNTCTSSSHGRSRASHIHIHPTHGLENSHSPTECSLDNTWVVIHHPEHPTRYFRNTRTGTSPRFFPSCKCRLCTMQCSAERAVLNKHPWLCFSNTPPVHYGKPDIQDGKRKSAVAFSSDE